MSYPYDLDLSFGSELCTADSFFITKVKSGNNSESSNNNPSTEDPETPDPETPDPETPDPETPDPETPNTNTDPFNGGFSEDDVGEGN